MLTKRYRTEEILSQLRQAKVELSRGCLLSNTAVVRFDSCPTRSAPLDQRLQWRSGTAPEHSRRVQPRVEQSAGQAQRLSSEDVRC